MAVLPCVRTQKLDASHVNVQKRHFLQKLFAYTEKSYYLCTRKSEISADLRSTCFIYFLRARCFTRCSVKRKKEVKLLERIPKDAFGIEIV